MSFPSSRFEAGKDGRRGVMKHPANGAKLVRGAHFSDNKAHWGKENTHGWQPISLRQWGDLGLLYFSSSAENDKTKNSISSSIMKRIIMALCAYRFMGWIRGVCRRTAESFLFLKEMWNLHRRLWNSGFPGRKEHSRDEGNESCCSCDNSERGSL